jgi:hypothetical protein
MRTDTCTVFKHFSAELKRLPPDQLLARLFDSGRALRVGWTCPVVVISLGE